ncbi:MAG: NYN domain-containing protein, partial [bacterium]|nr:NYN domain-containing protein [bacterium]
GVSTLGVFSSTPSVNAYVYDEVMIKDIQPGDEIATLDETTGKISWQKVKALLDMGVKTAHRLATADGRQIRTTKEHPYLVKDLNGRDPKHSSPINGAGWVAAGEIKAGEFIAVPKPKVGVFIDDANMFYAQKKAGWRIDYGKLRELLAYSFEVKFMNYYLAMPGVSDTAFKKTEKFLEPFRRAFGSILTFRTKPLKYIYDEERKEWIKKGNVDSEVLLDVLDRLEELDVVVIMSGDSDYKALAQTLAKKGKKVLFAGFEDNMAWELRQMKHLYLNRVREAVELGANKKAPEKTGVPLLSLVYSRQELLSSGDVDNGFVWARVDGVEKVAEEQVYDIEVEGTHNFIGNDIVAHNTYVSGTGFFGGAITATSTLNVTGLTTLGYASTTQIGSTGSAYFATSGGNVGIGTTSPAGKLDVNGDLVLRDSLLLGTTVESEGLISWSGTNFVIRGATDRALSLGSNGVNSRILIDTVGNVGIGTTTPNSLLSVANTGTRQLMLTDTDGGVDLKHMYIESADGTLRFGEFNDALTTATERIRIDASGNVGIGTTSPVGLLSVEMGTNQFPFWVGDEGTSTPAFVVRGSGNIGIGTGAPAKLLDVNGGMIRIQRSNDAVGLKVMNTDADAIGNRSQITMSPSATFTGETEGSYIYSIQETVNAPFQVGLGFGTYDVTPQDRMIIKAGGNVGIGTTTPNSILNIAGATPKFTLTDNNAGANLKHWFLQSTGGAFRISTTSDALVDQTAPPPFVITSGGNIGIGTTSPYELFSVSGRAVITATTTIGVSSTAQQAGINIGFGGLCVDNDGTCVASTTGRISSVTSTTGNTDVAEIYLSDEILEKGDIVAAAGGTKVKKASLDNLAGIIGVVSTDPGVILGLGPDQTAEANYPIALVGRVPVKVNLESGPIKIGDRITSSSVAGVGTRATTSGMTVGIALEPFSDAATTTGKILVFVNLGYSKLDSEIAGGNASGWIVDQASGRIKTSYTLDMDNKDIVNARRILSASGLWSIDENGKLIVQEIQTQKLTVTGPQGITIYDEDTGTPYCLKMKSGQIVSVSGTCVFNPSAPSASSTPSAPPADTTPPTITILGNNPAIINIGASYADPGITITDNVDQNLGYTASLDGGPPLSQGAGLSLDTSTTTTHAILYTATDNAGNSANATRIVQVTAPL